MIKRNIGYIAVDSYENDGGGSGGYAAPTTSVYEQPVQQDIINPQPQILPMAIEPMPPEEIPTTINDLSQTYVTGYVVDDKTGMSLSGTVQLIINGTALEAVSFTDTYQGWTTYNPSQASIRFAVKGYQAQTIPFTQLMIAPDVLMKKAFPWWILLMMAGAVMVYRKKTGKVGKLSTGDIFPIMLIVGGAIGFGLIKDVLEFLGLWKSQDTKDLDAASTDSGNFWNPNYWMTIKPADKNWTYAIDSNTALSWAREIFDSFGAFNDCEECAIAVTKRCRTKANFSFLAYIFQQEYSQDLLTFLRGGWWPQDRLSDADVNTINQYISTLPNY